jgi:hypothetical protein
MTFWKVDLSRRFTSYIERVSQEFQTKFEVAQTEESRPMVARNFRSLEKFHLFTKLVDGLVTGKLDPQKFLRPFGSTTLGTEICVLQVSQWRGSFLSFPKDTRYLGAFVSEISFVERLLKSRDPFWERFP